MMMRGMAKKNLGMARIVLGLTTLAAAIIIYWGDDSASDLGGSSPRQLAAKSNVVAPPATAVVDVVWFKDGEGSCPGACMDVFHNLFGPEVTVVHHYNVELPLPPSSNLLVIARPVHIPTLAKNLQKLRDAGGMVPFVGLFEQADLSGGSGDAMYYGQFDYVLRNHYHHELLGAPPSIYLRAMGNLTCGTALPEYPKLDSHAFPYHDKARPGEHREPWLGVHWITNENGSPQPLSEVIPSSKRPVDCSFVGSLRSHRKEMVETFQNSDVDCSMKIFSKFLGEIPKDEYLNQHVAQSKITLAPWGNSHETIRAAEGLNYGSIPVIIRDGENEHEYINKFFRPIPALYADNWEEARDLVQDVLENWEPDRLDKLQASGVEWKHEYQECIRGDMLKILSHNPSFDIAKNE